MSLGTRLIGADLVFDVGWSAPVAVLLNNAPSGLLAASEVYAAPASCPRPHPCAALTSADPRIHLGRSDFTLPNRFEVVLVLRTDAALAHVSQPRAALGGRRAASPPAPASLPLPPPPSSSDETETTPIAPVSTTTTLRLATGPLGLDDGDEGAALWTYARCAGRVTGARLEGQTLVARGEENASVVSVRSCVCSEWALMG